jgi:ABC-type multidrug transport system fused ATPase/permease subunit
MYADGCLGYDTKVGERGLRLSGGEKVRLNFAFMFCYQAFTDLNICACVNSNVSPLQELY